MIALKALLAGVGLSVIGTFVYVVLLYSWSYRLARLATPSGATGSIGWDITSLGHNTYLAPAYWLFVVGLFSTGCAIVFLLPRPVVTP
jgi:hypothetical protein